MPEPRPSATAAVLGSLRAFERLLARASLLPIGVDLALACAVAAATDEIRALDDVRQAAEDRVLDLIVMLASGDLPAHRDPFAANIDEFSRLFKSSSLSFERAVVDGSLPRDVLSSPEGRLLYLARPQERYALISHWVDGMETSVRPLDQGWHWYPTREMKHAARTDLASAAATTALLRQEAEQHRHTERSELDLASLLNGATSLSWARAGFTDADLTDAVVTETAHSLQADDASLSSGLGTPRGASLGGVCWSSSTRWRSVELVRQRSVAVGDDLWMVRNPEAERVAPAPAPVA